MLCARSRRWGSVRVRLWIVGRAIRNTKYCATTRFLGRYGSDVFESSVSAAGIFCYKGVGIGVNRRLRYGGA